MKTSINAVSAVWFRGSLDPVQG